jgi:hypothetical protein
VIARRWLRVCTVAGGAIVLTSFARADAPTGQDGQYNLFNLNSDVIQDVQTGLYWQRYASTTAVDYASSFGVCASLSLDTMTTGWRVPSYKELMTLVDEVPHTEYEGGSLVYKAIDSHAFPGTATTNPYWTSSPYVSQSNSAYVINFRTGVPTYADMSSAGYFVRCVHD